MKEIKRIGVDLGKRAFHVTTVGAKGGIVERERRYDKIGDLR